MTMSSVNKDSFISSFTNSILLVSSSLVMFAITSYTMLKRSVEREHPCFDTGISGTASNFSLVMILAIGIFFW